MFKTHQRINHFLVIYFFRYYNKFTHANYPTGTSAKAWKKVNSPRHERTWRRLSETTMRSPSRRPTCSPGVTTNFDVTV